MLPQFKRHALSILLAHTQMKEQNADHKTWHEIIIYTTDHVTSLLLIMCKQNCITMVCDGKNQNADALYEKNRISGVHAHILSMKAHARTQ